MDDLPPAPAPTFACDAYALFDDLLDEEAWAEVWSYFQFEALAPVTRTEGAWKLQDGQPFAGPDFHVLPEGADAGDLEGVYPTETPLDYLAECLVALAPRLGRWVGAFGHIAGRAYVYPPGTGLSWHRDAHDRYAGAFVYYAHPEWNVDWGGELLVAEVDDPAALPVMPFRFDNRDFSERLLEAGRGRFIAPKPNRLVVLGALPHRIAPVRGPAVRASVAGFFVR